MKIGTLRHSEVQPLALSHAASKVAGSELEPRELIGPASISDASVLQLNQVRISTRRFREALRKMYWFPRAAITKVPRTGLKTTEVYSLPVLESRSPKSRCWQGWFLVEAPKENPLS